MFSLSAFFTLFRAGTRGYPIMAYSKVRTPFQRARNLNPPVFVTVSTERGCLRITYSQGEFAARYRL